jgi:hypothetical protein
MNSPIVEERSELVSETTQREVTGKMTLVTMNLLPTKDFQEHLTR